MQHVIIAVVLIILAVCNSKNGYCIDCNAGFGYESADRSCIECPSNTFSEGGLDSCDKCTDGETWSACDKTNGFCTIRTEGDEYNPNIAKCHKCHDADAFCSLRDGKNGDCIECKEEYKYVSNN